MPRRSLLVSIRFSLFLLKKTKQYVYLRLCRGKLFLVSYLCRIIPGITLIFIYAYCKFLFMTIAQKQAQMIRDFEFLDNWEQKYEYLIDLGKELPKMAAEKKIEENLIRGCQSQVWMTAALNDGKIHYEADSDGILPKGIIAMLVSIFNDQPIKAILDADFKFIETLGLKEFLSPSRANGLLAMTKQIKFYALALQAKS